MKNLHELSLKRAGNPTGKGIYIGLKKAKPFNARQE